MDRTSEPLILPMGARLNLLKERSGLSLREIAARGGWRGASSVQKLFAENYNVSKISRKTVEKLAKAFEGTGNPAIDAKEVFALAGIGSPEYLNHISEKEGRFFAKELIKYIIPVYPTVASSDIIVDTEGQSPELLRQAPLGFQDIVYYECPDHQKNEKIIGFILSTDSMWPRFHRNETVFIRESKQTKAGDYAILLLGNSFADSPFICCRVDSADDHVVRVQQFNPNGSFSIKRSIVRAVFPILRPADLLSISGVIKALE